MLKHDTIIHVYGTRHQCYSIFMEHLPLSPNSETVDTEPPSIKLHFV